LCRATEEFQSQTNHQKIIKKSSKNHQKIIKQSSPCLQWILIVNCKNHQKIIIKNHQKIIKKASTHNQYDFIYFFEKRCMFAIFLFALVVLMTALLAFGRHSTLRCCFFVV
jgi:uncharacterized membrane protein